MESGTEKGRGRKGRENHGARRRYTNKLNHVMSFSSYLIFFVNVCALSVMNLLLYGQVVRMFDNNLYDWRAIAAVAVNVIFISALVCLIDGTRRRFTIEAPLIRIMEGLDHISHGEYGYQIEPPYTRRVNEFDDIIDSINELSRELANTETLKTDFVANVTHEMKTPLAIILNHASLLQNAHLTDEERKEYTETLVNASRRLNGLVVNMLKLNKLEKQNIYPEQKPFNVGEQIRNVFLAFEGAWSEKDLDIDIDVEDVMVEGDEGLLEIVWSNLISNAIKFTPDGGLLRVMLREERSDGEKSGGEKSNGGKKNEEKNGDRRVVTVTVQDSGCGMDEATGKHMFDKFYQGDSSHAKEGNGLGLAMVKRVIDIVEGEISVDSKVGVGTTFTVKIPSSGKLVE